MDVDAIREVMPEILQAMVVNVVLLTNLISQDVLTIFDKESIMAKLTNTERVDELMEHIMKDLDNKFNPLLVALKATGQHNVVSILTGWSNSTPSECRNMAFHRCMDKLKTTYRSLSAKFSILKNHPNLQHYSVNMTRMFTNLRLLDKRTDDVEGIGTQVTIQKALNCGSRNFVAIGVPGSGKSCCVLNVADLWGRMNEMDNTSSKAEVTNPLPAHIKQVIYIRPQDCKSTLDETVESILKCRCGDDYPAAIEHYQSHPEETAVLMDSLDEVMQNKQLIADVFQTMNNGKRLMLAGCRTNHPLLDSISDGLKIKWIQVEGFDDSHIKEYIEKFFCDPCDQVVAEKFKQAIDKDSKLAKIVRNPLVLCLICILIKAGKYAVDDLHSVRKIDIFNKITELVMEREGTSDPSDLEKFYKFSFLRLVDGEGFFEDDMKSFGIKEPRSLPFVSFDDADIAETRRGCQMVLPHRSFAEFACAKCILTCDQKTRDFLLMMLAARREFNHVLNLLAELLHLDISATVHICNSILALQPERLKSWHFSSCTTSSNGKKKKKILKKELAKIIEKRYSGGIKCSLGATKPCHTCWMKKKYISTDEGRAVFHNALSFIQTMEDETLRNEIFSGTLTPLLPYGFEDGQSLQAVPKTDRCALLVVKDHGVYKVISNRPSDIVHSNLLSKLPNTTRLQCLQLCTSQTGILYGDAEHKSTKEEWQELFQWLPAQSGQQDRYSMMIELDSDCGTLFLALASSISGPCNKGVKSLTIKTGELNISAVMDCKLQMKADSWTVSEFDNNWTINCRRGIEKIEINIDLTEFTNIYLSENTPLEHSKRLGAILPAARKLLKADNLASLQLQVPGTTRRVRLSYHGIQSERPEDVIETGALSLYTGQERYRLTMEGVPMVDGHHREVYTPSQEEWESFIDQLVQHEKIIKAGGWLNFKGYDNFDSLLAAISERVEQLGKYTQGGHIRLLNGEVTGGVLLSLMNKLSQHWEIREGYGMELYNKGGEGGKVLSLRLWDTSITCSSREEQDQVKKVTQDTGVLIDPTWKIVK